jgi:type IV secretion system protein TrbL
MGGTGVIDNFLGVFTSYIDSGFGLLGGEVAFIATTLIVIDMTLAALFWAWGADDDIIARLVKKTLFVGIFAFLISNWNSLARIVFESFAGLGLLASGTGFSPRPPAPGRVAQTGLDAGRPLLEPSPTSWASSPSSRTSSRSPACSSPGRWCCWPSSSSRCSSSSR